MSKKFQDEKKDLYQWDKHVAHENYQNETTRLLTENVRVARDIHEIESHTLSRLQTQGEHLQESQSYLHSMKELTENARDSIKTLKIKLFRQKLYIWLIIGILFIVDLTLLIVLIKNGGKFYNK